MLKTAVVIFLICLLLLDLCASVKRPRPKPTKWAVTCARRGQECNGRRKCCSELRCTRGGCNYVRKRRRKIVIESGTRKNSGSSSDSDSDKDSDDNGRGEKYVYIEDYRDDYKDDYRDDYRADYKVDYNVDYRDDYKDEQKGNDGQKQKDYTEYDYNNY
ncbi:unnamed protein product [Candidula unifasciata]|uniref:Uncharacterized protein n=1 Tax=Candidula unifasciata TaxID=100452 RepID=A0A8S3ZRY3_9EUPU|nr:unnamed protein product [Candidula unifasciata]